MADLTSDMRSLPPGSLGLPIVGETIGFLRDPNFALTRHNRYGDVFKTRLFGNPTVFMRGADANQFIFSNENRFFRVSWPASTRALLGKLSLALQSGTMHQSRRKLLAQAFMPRALDSYISAMSAITRRYLTRWAQQGTLTWYPELRHYTFDVACKLLVGLDDGAQTRLGQQFETWCQGLFSVPINLPWTPFGKAMRSRQQLLQGVEALIRQRQQADAADVSDQPSADALGLLLRAEDDHGDRLSIDELNDQILLLLFAGHETLTSAIASFCLLMAQHPQILAQLRDEQRSFDASNELTLDSLRQMTQLEHVLQEVLRLIPPVGGGFRDVIQSCEFQGYHLPQGWNVLYSISQTHQDVALYPQPEQFNPSRFDPAQPQAVSDDVAEGAGKLRQKYGYVPFGGGIRECLGKEFARLEMKIFAVHLIRGYDWALLPDQDVSMVTVPTPHPKDGLRVKFSPYERSTGTASTSTV